MIPVRFRKLSFQTCEEQGRVELWIGPAQLAIIIKKCAQKLFIVRSKVVNANDSSEGNGLVCS